MEQVPAQCNVYTRRIKRKCTSAVNVMIGIENKIRYLLFIFQNGINVIPMMIMILISCEKICLIPVCDCGSTT